MVSKVRVCVHAEAACYDTGRCGRSIVLLCLRVYACRDHVQAKLKVAVAGHDAHKRD